MIKWNIQLKIRMNDQPKARLNRPVISSNRSKAPNVNNVKENISNYTALPNQNKQAAEKRKRRLNPCISIKIPRLITMRFSLVKMNYLPLYLIVTLFVASGCQMKAGRALYVSDSYSLYSKEVRQGAFVAKAQDRTTLYSNYKSEAKKVSAVVNYKFSINGEDNASPAGENSWIVCTGSKAPYAPPLVKFGEAYKDNHPRPKAGSNEDVLPKDTKLHLKVDMRDVFKAFKEQGYYLLASGKKLYQSDFHGVYVAGSVAPLTWDFANLSMHKDLELKDEDSDGIYETYLTLNQDPDAGKTSATWKLDKDLSAFPAYYSPDPLPDALYNLALSEMQNAIEPDSTFRTGKQWAGVWTRDISYSIILSMAILQPRVAMISLKRKVKNGKIIQDTGTGGSYPVSSDRIVWAIAAWEVYKVTGDNQWLEYAYGVIKQTQHQDKQLIYDQMTGLVKGESSFLDWREQTYPKWMQPADIYASECLGTNAVHYEANQILAKMAAKLNLPKAEKSYQTQASMLKSAINNKLWQPDKGYYGQYLYGRNGAYLLSPKAEALGESLAVLFDIADKNKQQAIIRNTPVTPFGITCIFPQIPGIPPYHNDAIWPFVQSYWALASAKAGNEASVARAMSAIYRPAGLFLTNKENFVATNGDYGGTQINSSNMLWSLSGSLAIVYKLLFGMHFEVDQLVFKPFVPKVYKGDRKLTNFKYRRAVLDIELQGYGNQIQRFELDGQKKASASVPGDLVGRHHVRIILTSQIQKQGAKHEAKQEADNGAYKNAGNSSVEINASNNPDREGFDKTAIKLARKDTNHLVSVLYSPDMVKAVYKSGHLILSSTDSSLKANKIYLNGRLWKTVGPNEQKISIDTSYYGIYQVVSINKNNLESFASEPIEISPARSVISLQVEDFGLSPENANPGFTGSGYVKTTTEKNRQIRVHVNIKQKGTYLLSLRYANGSGPINTENKCAIRTLLDGSHKLGTLVMPQRGKDEWSNWGWSNKVRCELDKGDHELEICLKPADENMNVNVNEALIDEIQIMKISND